MATAVKPGFFRSTRKAYRRSCQRVSTDAPDYYDSGCGVGRYAGTIAGMAS
jgi:hypothetical protein